MCSDIIKKISIMSKEERRLARHRIEVIFRRAELLAENGAGNSPSRRKPPISRSEPPLGKAHKILRPAIGWLMALAAASKADRFFQYIDLQPQFLWLLERFL